MSNKFFTFLILSLVVISSFPTQALAISESELLRQSKYCTENFSRQERNYGIPKHLLMAVSATESGRWHKGAGLALPWPWAVNAEGKGFYFDSKHDAVTAVKRMQQQGIKSIDIGCMQINLKHHPKAFTSVEQAFTPSYNIRYGAKFLRNNYNQMKSWERAASAYHSKTRSKGKKYFKTVKKNWKRILAAVSGNDGFSSKYVRTISDGRQASQKVARMLDDSSQDAPYGSTLVKRKKLKKKLRHKQASFSKKKGLKRHKTPRMKVIQVSKADAPKSNEVVVIRPVSKKSKPIVVANNVSESTATTQHFVMGSQQSDFQPIRKSSSRKNGPNFIFR